MGSCRSRSGWRRSTRLVRALASVPGWACCGGSGEAAGHERCRSRRSQDRAMSVYFEELDFRPTPMGVLSLRRRRQLSSGVDIYEIKLGDEFLMSSQFTAAEIELARLGLAAVVAWRSRCRRRWPRARLYRARRAREFRRAVVDRDRRAGRGHRMARRRVCFLSENNSPAIRVAASSMAISLR